MKTVLELGENEKHAVAIECSVMSGHWTIAIDGKQAHSSYCLVGRTSIKVAFGRDEKHELELRISPILCRHFAYVDGKLHSQLFPHEFWVSLLIGLVLALMLSVIATKFVAMFTGPGTHRPAPSMPAGDRDPVLTNPR